MAILQSSKLRQPSDTATAAIEQYALQLNGRDVIGELECPFCFGGKNKDKAFAVGRSSHGTVWYRCHRASCMRRGHIGTPRLRAAAVAEVTTEAPVHQAKGKFQGLLIPLTPDQLEYVGRRWGLSEEQIARSGVRWAVQYDRMFIPLRDKDGLEMGCILRSLNKDAPTKSLTFWWGHNSNAIGFFECRASTRAIIVEDPLSAMRASDYINAVCLCGVGLALNQVKQIRDAGYSRIYMCLDYDAADTGLDHVMKHKAYMPMVFAVFKKDLKDMEESELIASIGSLTQTA